MIRKIARECVIFMLAGMALSAVAMFMYSYRDQAQHIRIERNALKTTCAHAQNQPPQSANQPDVDAAVANHFGEPPPTAHPTGNGTITFNPSDIDEAATAAEETHSIFCSNSNIERIKNLKIDFYDCGLAGGVGGGFGFVVGLGVWLLVVVLSACSVCGQGVRCRTWPDRPANPFLVFQRFQFCA